MNWLNEDRESYPPASSHHQTLLGKALYEHGDCKVVAAVAASSSSIQNSSLGPNLLALVYVEKNTLPLFGSVFLSCENNTTLRFTRKLSIRCEEHSDSSTINRLENFVASLINNTKYFQKSLQEMSTELESYSFWSFLLASYPGPIFTSLKKLVVRFCVSEELLQNIATTFPVLETLQLQNFPVDEASAEWFTGLSKLTKLTSVNLSWCTGITDESVRAIAINCVYLTSLNLRGCSNMGDAGLHAIASRLLHLTSLDLGSCRKATDIGLESLVAGCANLTSLSLASCKNLTDVGVQRIAAGLLDLKSLDLSYCNKITDASLAAIADGVVANLTSLRLTSCTQVTDVGVEAIGAKLANLTSLDVAFCDEITDAGVEVLARNCTNLTSLDLAYCDEITDAGLHFILTGLVNLTFLNLQDCTKITDAAKAKAEKALPHLKIRC